MGWGSRRGQQGPAAFEKGDIDTLIAAFADNAVFTPSLQAFRVEGKAGIKGLLIPREAARESAMMSPTNPI
jgi:ketosteroid isomerase-like protein